MHRAPKSTSGLGLFPEERVAVSGCRRKKQNDGAESERSDLRMGRQAQRRVIKARKDDRDTTLGENH